MQTPQLSIQDKLSQRAAKRDQEFELWQRWKSGDQMALEPLLKSLAPIIRKISLNYQGNLPPAFIEGEVKKNVLIALQGWDPNLSQMNTHIQNQCMKVLREIYKYQNPTRLAEESHLRVPVYQNIYSNLQEQLGRPPTTLDIAREMKIGVTEVRRLQTGARRDLGAIEGAGTWRRDPVDREQEILDMVWYELGPQEAQVYEMTYGLHGKKEMPAKDIADRLHITPARVSQIRAGIALKMNKYFGGHKLPGTGIM